jgi:nucleoside-diphosphate-sugar epimerase
MRIFVTGATGTLGSAIVGELLDGGHEVIGLTSSDERAGELDERGVRPVVGDLGDPGTWRDAAARAEGFVHAAFDYGADDPVEADAAAIDAILSAAGEGSGPRVFAYTSGVWVLGETGDRPVDESSPLRDPFPKVAWRPAHEETVLGASGRTSGAVVRPGVVYGGARGLVVPFFETAEAEGAAVYLGDGANRMALVHRDDNARLYRALLERRAGGLFHSVDGSPMAMVDVARAASEAAGAGGEVRSRSLVEAREELGPVADALCLDQVVAAPRSRAELGWTPRYASFREGAAAAWRELLEERASD